MTTRSDAYDRRQREADLEWEMDWVDPPEIEEVAKALLGCMTEGRSKWEQMLSHVRENYLDYARCALKARDRAQRHAA